MQFVQWIPLKVKDLNLTYVYHHHSILYIRIFMPHFFYSVYQFYASEFHKIQMRASVYVICKIVSNFGMHFSLLRYSRKHSGKWVLTEKSLISILSICEFYWTCECIVNILYSIICYAALFHYDLLILISEC